MDGFVRAIGGGISGFVGNAAAAVGGAIHAVIAELERVVPGGALPLVLLAVVVLLLAWNLLRR
jgi:hypothetical protein